MSGSGAVPSSAASSTSTSGPHKSRGQDQWPSSGTPQASPSTKDLVRAITPACAIGSTPAADMNPHQSQAFVLDVSVAQVKGGYTIGTSPVHDRYMTGSTRSSPERDTGNPCGMTPPLVQRPTRAQRRSPRHRARLPPGSGRRALGHRLPGSLDGRARADPAAFPGRRYEQDQPAAQLEQNGGEPAAGRPRRGPIRIRRPGSRGRRRLGPTPRHSTGTTVAVLSEESSTLAQHVTQIVTKGVRT